jgi:autotransporter-associated beta strand protein
MKKLSSAFFCRGVLALFSVGFVTFTAQAQIVDNVPTGTTEVLATPTTGPTSVIINQGGNPAFMGTQVYTGGGPATANTYSGSTSVQGGTLQAGAGSGVGNAFSPNSDFILSNTGTLDLNGTTQTIASLASTDNLGNVTNTGGGNGTLIIDDTHSSLVPKTYEYDGVITDAGAGNTLAIVKAGSGTLILTNANSYAGGTTINGGTLAVSGASLGSGSVTNAAKLESTASLGLSGPQTIAIGSNYTQMAGGTLQIQVADSPSATPSTHSGVAGTDYDTTSVAGTATLAGTLALNFAAPTVPSQGQQFVVLTAGGPLTTVFATPAVTNLPKDFIPVTTYNDTFGGNLNDTAPDNSVVVTLVRAFTSYGGLTSNQQAVAADVDGNLLALNRGRFLLSPSGNVKDFINNIITGLDFSTYAPDGLGSALDELSPQRFEILRNVAIDNYTFDVQSLDDQLARERYGHGGIDTSGFVMNDSALGTTLSQVKSRLLAWNPAPEHGLLSDSGDATLGGVKMTDPKDVKEMAPVAATNQWNTFIDGGADLGDLQHNVDTNHSTYTTGRIRAGGDYLVAKDVRIGALFGYAHTDADLDNEGSTAEVDSYTPGIYATFADKEGFYANALVSGTFNQYSTDRNVIIPGVSRTAQGDTNGAQFGANLDGGYEFHRGDWSFGPAIGLTYTHMGIDSFTENGATAANLALNDWHADSLRSRFGGTVRYAGRIGSVTVTPHLSAFYQHEFLNDDTQITSHFAGLPGGNFTVDLPSGDSDDALIDFGIDGEITQNVTLFLDYETEVGTGDFYGQAATGGVKVSF